MNKNDVHIALLMMVKNEHKRLHVSLNSVLGYVDSIVMYDTGSEDNTIEIASNFCKKNNITFRLKEGTFVDFSTSRNVSLDFADTFEDIDYLLLLDSNDELQGGSQLRKFCNEQINSSITGFLVCQEWWNGQCIKYYNLRRVKARQGWRYVGTVHEWMKNTRFKTEEEEKSSEDKKIRIPEVLLYQDRTADDDKSSKRFIRDKILLLKEHEDNPSDTRTIFYLAQTCACLGHLEEAFKFYSLRSTLEGFWEEKFQSFFKCGEVLELMGNEWYDSMKWYLKAFDYTPRVEPLIKIVEYYRNKNWHLSYTFCMLACKLNYPEHCILFVDKQMYDYKRWHLLGIVGWYSGNYSDGKLGCKKAIEVANLEIDKSNLKFYEEKEINDKKILKDELKDKLKNKIKSKKR